MKYLIISSSCIQTSILPLFNKLKISALEGRVTMLFTFEKTGNSLKTSMWLVDAINPTFFPSKSSQELIEEFCGTTIKARCFIYAFGMNISSKREGVIDNELKMQSTLPSLSSDSLLDQLMCLNTT